MWIIGYIIGWYFCCFVVVSFGFEWQVSELVSHVVYFEKINVSCGVCIASCWCVVIMLVYLALILLVYLCQGVIIIVTCGP